MMRPLFLRAHVRQDGFGHAHDAEDVDVEESLGLRDRILLGGPRGTHTGVVDQNIDPPELREYPLDQQGDRVVTCHVEVKECHALAADQSVCVAAGSDDVETRFDQGLSCELAEACVGTRDECDWPRCRHVELPIRLKYDRNIRLRS